MTYADFERIVELRKLMAFELAEAENCHEQATSMTIRLTGMPRGSGGTSSIVENAVVRAETHYDRYLRYDTELQRILTALRKESEKLPDEQKEVIRLYYCDRNKAGKIAQMKGVTERHVFRLKREAIEGLCLQNSQ